MAFWQTSRRELSLDRPLVMAILNVTPDSFSDGGKFFSAESAIRHAQVLIAEGADILDIGGESTRPDSSPVTVEDEIQRVVPVIEAISKRFDIPISVDTTKSRVAKRAIAAGAEIINDISGLRFDDSVADVASRSGAGLVLMHSRGSFESLHSQPPISDILADVIDGLRRAVGIATLHGVARKHIALDVGIGFGKTYDQNLELIGKLDKIVSELKGYPMLVGASRKSFIGRIVGDGSVAEPLGGSLAAAVIAVRNGAAIIRVHDVRETIAALKVAAAIQSPIYLGKGRDQQK